MEIKTNKTQNPKVSIMDRQSRSRKLKENPKVSIIIPVYNGSNFLREAIESSLAQTYKNLEIIVVNDGSKDHGSTEKIAKSFGDKIRYFKKKNGKVSTALNLGIKEMTGDYFSWLSHDDLYTPDKIAKQIKFILKCPLKTLVYCNYEVVDRFRQHLGYSQLKPIRKSNLIRALMEDRFIHGCALLIPKSAFADAGLFDPKLLNTQDFDLWFRLMDIGYDFRLCPGYLVRSRKHNQQDSVTTSDRQMVEEDVLYLNVLKHFSADRLFTKSKNISLDYINIALANKIIGLLKTADYAYNSSKNYIKKDNYFSWLWMAFLYNLWSKSASYCMNCLIQIVRRLKRK